MAKIAIRNIRAFTILRDAITVSWEIVPTKEDLATWTVQVFRSEAEMGPYVPVSSKMVAEDIYEFRDTTVNLFRLNHEHHYRIRVSNGPDTVDYGSAPWKDVLGGTNPRGVVMEPPPDLIAAEAIRRLRLTMGEFYGTKILFLKKRTWGQHCKSCYDQLTRRVDSSRCKSCFATGFTGGYFSPQATRWRKLPGEKAQQVSDLFALEVSDALVWMMDRPRASPGDVILAPDGRRFHVVKIQHKEKLEQVVRQVVQVRELDKAHSAYLIPIPQDAWDVSPATATPKREYLRATDIDSFFTAQQDAGRTE